MTTYLADCETQLCKVPRQGLLYGVPVSLKECFSYKVRPAPLPAGQLWALGHPGPSEEVLGPKALRGHRRCVLPWPAGWWWEQTLCVEAPWLITHVPLTLHASRARTRHWA